MPLEKKSKMTFQLSYVKRSRAYESLELYTTYSKTFYMLPCLGYGNGRTLL